jgi:hypothetical protein
MSQGEEPQPFPTLTLKTADIPFKLALTELTAFIEYEDGEEHEHDIERRRTVRTRTTELSALV